MRIYLDISNMFELRPWNTFINSWNMFSRVFILKWNLKNKNIIILENENEMKLFQKIWKFLSWNSPIPICTVDELLWFLISDDGVFITTWDILVNLHISKYELEKNIISIERWKEYWQDDILLKLDNYNYSYSQHLSKKWGYNRDWDTINILDGHWKNIFRITFFWDEVDEILKMDISNTRILGKLDNLKLPNLGFISNQSQKNIIDIRDRIVEYTTWSQVFVIWWDLWEHRYILDNVNPIVLCDLPKESSKNLDVKEIKIADLNEFESLLKESWISIRIYTKNTKTINNFIEYNSIVWDIKIIETPAALKVLESFQYKEWDRRFFYICDDILSDIFIEKRIKRSLAKNIDLMLDMKVWDYVVHIDHWIWIFNAIVKKDLSWISREYIEIEYRENDKLFVPISELHRVSKYIWDENPKLTRLNTNEWQKILKNCEADVERIANELLWIYAERNLAEWFEFRSFPDKEKQFFESFKYNHTIDQRMCIQDVLADMEKVKPMDRLVVWDVGFWKTEVAMNAIYNVIYIDVFWIENNRYLYPHWSYSLMNTTNLCKIDYLNSE